MAALDARGEMDTLSAHTCFGGRQSFHRHLSREIGAPMRFAVYRPPAAGPLPIVLCLAGLTCTEETFAIKAGAQRRASELGLMLVMPDVSPRETGIAEAEGDWELGHGAGFYVDATQAPWSQRFRMESWIVRELLPLVVAQFGGDASRIGVLGHSMGGHGALVLAMRHRTVFLSVSALAPISAAASSPWGEKAFSHYLGSDRSVWAHHDASRLMEAQTTAPFPSGILIDQGMADSFLAAQLRPQIFEEACAKVGQPLQLRRHEGYDHGYWFISTFIDDHLRHHHARLNR